MILETEKILNRCCESPCSLSMFKSYCKRTYESGIKNQVVNWVSLFLNNNDNDITTTTALEFENNFGFFKTKPNAASQPQGVFGEFYQK